MSAPPHEWTVDAYLAYERAAATRHEFIAGQVSAMAGASERHNLIASALSFRLYGQLLDRPCAVFQSDMRVQAADTAYFYPDLAVVCGEAQYRDDQRDTLLNPSVLIEVLSPSTEDVDRGRKFLYYREIASLTDYVLVAQSRMQVEHYTRQAADRWLLTVLSQPTDVLTLDSIDCTLALSDIYRQVTFADDEDAV